MTIGKLALDTCSPVWTWLHVKHHVKCGSYAPLQVAEMYDVLLDSPLLQVYRSICMWVMST